MALPQQFPISETENIIKGRLKTASRHELPRLKMLLQLSRGLFSMDKLAAKVGASRNAIAVWKKLYKTGGLDALLADHRGGDYRSGFSAADRKLIEDKISDPKDALTSFKGAQEWINAELGTDKKYHAVNKYLKRNFGAKLKVGRKSHVKKDEEAVAFFKKPLRAD